MGSGECRQVWKFDDEEKGGVLGIKVLNINVSIEKGYSISLKKWATRILVD